jgi:uncharacterized protein (DUF1501 family)
MSEFGRTIGENGIGGTDHGHATAMLALGGPVNGGRVLGKWPGLDQANLAVTTDVRDLFDEIVAHHLGAGDLVANPQRFPGAIRT